VEENNKILLKYGKKYNFLLDTSAILYFQVMHEHSGASIFKALEECRDVNFFVIDLVLSELIQGSKGLNPTQLTSFFNHILTSESAMEPNRKENRFLITDGVEIKYLVLSNISATDYAQILVCQNHTRLVLVANDKKMLKSAAQVLEGRRSVGIPAFLDRLIFLYPQNERLKALKKTGDELFTKKHAFGNISEEKFNQTIKIRK